MKIFLDTSSLIKLYHREAGSYIVDNIFQQNTITEIFLSELTKIEFVSAFWKKARTQEITVIKAGQLITVFEKDFKKYTFIPINTHIISNAQVFITKYAQQGLRTLDCIQLSIAVSLINDVNLFVTSDKLMESFFKQEQLPV